MALALTEMESLMTVPQGAKRVTYTLAIAYGNEPEQLQFNVVHDVRADGAEEINEALEFMANALMNREKQANPQMSFTYYRVWNVDDPDVSWGNPPPFYED